MEVRNMERMLDVVPVSFTRILPFFDRVFDEWFYPYRITYAAECADWVPPSDIAETAKEYIVSMEAPGIDMNKTEITFTRGTVTVKGEKVKESKEDECCHCAERYSGSFERSFRVSDKVDGDKIDATYKDGILKVVLPKTEESSVKKIEVH
jgi:HSP20 family protein